MHYEQGYYINVLSIIYIYGWDVYIMRFHDVLLFHYIIEHSNDNYTLESWFTYYSFETNNVS